MTDRYEVPPDMLAAWNDELSHQARELNLDDAADRALLRRRMRGKADVCRVTTLIGLARALGVNLAGNTGRDDALRVLVDAWIALNA